MTFAWLHTTSTRKRKQSRRAGRRRASSGSATEKLRMERLEVRLALSGFGLEDGAYIVEDRSDSYYHDVQIQPGDQAILALGYVAQGYRGSPGRGVGVARYDSQGSLDTSYGVGGLSTPLLGPAQLAFGLAIQPDGKAVVAGEIIVSDRFGATTQVAVARLDLDGLPDASFGNGGWLTADIPQRTGDVAYGVALQSTGNVVIAGRAGQYRDPLSAALIARFTSDGTLDSGTGGFGQVVGAAPTGYTLTSYGGLSQHYSDLAVQTDDKLVTVGGITLSDDTSRFVMARYTATGAPDQTFNGTGYHVLLLPGISSIGAKGVAIQSDGKIVVVGSSSGIDGQGDMFVARFNVDGTLDTAFGDGNGYVRLDIDGATSLTREYATDVAIQPDGKIVAVGGQYSGRGETVNVLVARFNADGTRDLTFGNNGFKLREPKIDTIFHQLNAQAVALQADGTIIVGGSDNPGPIAIYFPMLMRFYGDAPPSPVIRGGDGEDTFHLLRSADELLVYHNIAPTGEPTERISLTGLTELTIDGGAGDDNLMVDAAGHPSLGIGRLVYNAGSGVNSLTLQGGAAQIDSTAAGGSLNTTVAAGAHLSTSHLQQNALTLAGADSRVTIHPGPGAPGQASVLTSLDLATGATLDITDNALVIDYTDASPAATIREKILAGRGRAGLGANWTGAGITSSTAAAANVHEPESRSVAYAENGALPLGPYTTFRGQAVDDTSVLIVYARTGDANLDGLVNDDDATILGATYAPGVPQPAWSLADFDYNGFVDDDDATLLGAFYQRSIPPAAPVPNPSHAGNTNNLTSTQASPPFPEASSFNLNRHARAALHSATVDQLLSGPESTWTGKSRVKLRV